MKGGKPAAGATRHDKLDQGRLGSDEKATIRNVQTTAFSAARQPQTCFAQSRTEGMWVNYLSYFTLALRGLVRYPLQRAAARRRKGEV